MIHPTAVVDLNAELDENVNIGAYAIIGADVKIESGTEIKSHAVLMGPTRIGKNNTIYPFASIGDDPQDKKYAGERTYLEIGEGNTIREYVTINRGTIQGGGITKLGKQNWIMAYAHIAHDCQVGNFTVFANNASLAGHIQVEDHAILGGFTLVHQYCRLGAYSFCGKGTGISKDVPPYLMVSGHSGKPRGLNLEGLKRCGFSAADIAELKMSYRILYRSKLTLNQAIEKLTEMAKTSKQIDLFVRFLQQSERGIVR